MHTLPRRCGRPVVLLVLFALCACRGTAARAVDFPGPDPREARARADGATLVLENEVLACEWRLADGRLKPGRIVDKLSGAALEMRDAECFRFLVARSPSREAQLVRASDLEVAAGPKATGIEPDPKSRRLADRSPGREIGVDLASADGNLRIEWRAVLGDGANYVRQRVRISATAEPVEIRELTLLETPAPGAEVVGSVDGSPAVVGSFFLAFEHPMSQSTVSPADGAKPATLRCAYPYAVAIVPGAPCEHSSVVGVAPEGQLRRGFLFYLERERTQPYRTFLHYNCGYQVGCEFWRVRNRGTPEEFERFVARQEPLWLELIDVFGRELVEKRGVVLDSCVHDHGWDDTSAVWQFHEGYRRGFAPQQAAAAKYGSRVGVWFSPWGGYSGRKLRIEAGQSQGFEVKANGLSLAGPRYYTRFRNACLGMVGDYGVNYFKFDGFGAGNNQPGAGPFASDVEGLLRLCGEIRRADADVFLNPTTGTWPSPFWLLWADAIWRQESDAGFLGKGSDRQQWITYRDNATYHSTIGRGPLYPISSLMLHGIMLHKYPFKNPYDPAGPAVSCRPEDVLAEIRSYFATGTNLQELHIDPSLMTESSWDALAEAARWSRANADVLADTHWIGGDPADGAIYGWASWSPRMGILALRNPSDQPAEIAVDPAAAFELPDGAPRTYALKSPWSADAAQPALTVAAGRPHSFRLEPFEVLIYNATPAESSRVRACTHGSDSQARE
jgi:hypothetical protein